MAAPGSMANGVLVFIPPNSTGILQQGQGVSGAISQTPQVVQYGPQQFRVMDPGNQPLGSTYPGSAGDQVAHLRKAGMMERFLKAQPKTLGAIQILTGLMHIGFSAVCAIFIGYYIPISFIGGYPFWGGFSFIISGSLSVAAEKHHKSCLVKGSLGMNITSAIFSAIGIILLLTELIINASFERHSWLGGAKGITAMLFLLTVLEFCIAVSTSHFASEALCYTPSDSMLYVPYVVNANVVVPAPQMASPQMAAPPPYSNMAYDPKEEIEHRAS